MSTHDSIDPDEAFALGAYASLPHSQPPLDVDARIRAAAHAVNAVRRPRRWTTGVATAAVAVLAVGLAWRGLDSDRPAYAPAAAPPAAPTLQPAFKLETNEPIAKSSEAKREAANARMAVPQPPLEPAMSSADWRAASAERAPPRLDDPRKTPVPAAESSVTPIFDEPLPMAAPAPPPAPPAPPAPALALPSPSMDQGTVGSAAETATAERRQSQSPSPPAKAENPGREASFRRDEDRAGVAADTSLPDDDRESDRLEQQSAFPAAAAGAAAPFVSEPKPDVTERERAGDADAQTARPNQPGAVVAPSPRGIRAGTTSYNDAVAAARAASARGDSATARALAAAIVSRFGRQRLPADLRQLNP